MALDAPAPGSDSVHAPKPSHEFRTRQRVLEVAVELLGQRGLFDGILPMAAERAGCQLERVEVFFRHDESLVSALYVRLAADLEACVPDLAEGKLAERFREVMHAKLRIVAPYRSALASLLASLLDPRHELGALSQPTEIIRGRVMGVFAAAVHGSTDCPSVSSDALIRALYAAHLGLMLMWTQDTSEGSQATHAAVDLIGDSLSTLVPFLSFPGSGPVLDRVDQVFTPLLAANDAEQTELAASLLGCLYRHRRLLPDAGSCAAQPCPQCLALHLPRVRHFVSLGQPILFLLPAFPAKSPCRRKTLGPLPDMAEQLALQYLRDVCRQIGELYPPGAKILICSDGHVFSDLVGVTDDDVTRYGNEIHAMLERLGQTGLETFSLADLYEQQDYQDIRRQLSEQYALPLENVIQRAKNHAHHRALFNGIQRFLFEEQVEDQSGKSRTQIRRECGRRAYQVIRYSDAWGRLLADCFPAAVRLSIHPQHPHSEKIGILLGSAVDSWLTPWHGVAVKEGDSWKLMKRHEAEAVQARVVDRFDRPSHFELP